MARGHTGIVSTPFVGRESELDDIWGHVSAALRGRPRLVLVSGQAGIGKTRLLREIEAVAARLGMRVVHGRASEDAATPYRLLRDLFERAAPGFGAALLREIIAAARREPLLILLDDLQWADSASLELLAQLISSFASDAPCLPLLIVAAHRPIAPGQRLLKWLASAQRESFASTLELHGLGWTETHAFLHALLHTPVEYPLVDAVQRITHGHPLFVRELLDQLQQNDLLQHTPERTALKAKVRSVALPQELRSALELRFARLNAEQLGLLTHAACAADSFSAAQLAELTRVGEEQVVRALECALEADLVRADAAGYRFRHALIRELLLQRAGATDRRALHARIAQLLAAYPPSGSTSAEIARQLVAARTPDLHSLLEHARRGAEHASAQLAWADAAALYGAAARAAEALADVPRHEVGTLYAHSALHHQRALAFDACLAQYARALALFERAGAVASQADVLRQRTRVEYISGTFAYGELLDVRAHVQLLAEPQRLGPEARGVLYEALALAYWNGRDTARAEQYAREALALAREAANDDNARAAQFCLGFVLFQAGQLTAAGSAYAASLGHASQPHDDWAQAIRLQRICAVHHALGQFDSAERACREAEHVGHGAQHAFVEANHALLALLRGELDAIRPHARTALSLCRRARWPWGGVTGLCTLAWARALEGQYADAAYAIGLLERPGVVFERPGPPARFMVAVFRAYLGACAGAEDPALLEHLARLVEVSAGVPLDAETAYLFCMLIEAAARAGLSPMPAWLHDRVARWFAQGMQFTPHIGLSLARVLGLSAAHLGRSDEAARYFDEAVRVTESAGAKPELARSLLDQAEWLAPARAALELATRARATFSELRLEQLAQRAHRLALTCGAQGLAPPAADSGDLNARERELLRQLSHGGDHSAIARELLLTPDRVAALTQALFAKLGIEGRALATAYAFAHGCLESVDTAGSDALMVTDLEDFSGFVRRLGDLHARTVMHAHNRILRRELCEHGGRELAHNGAGLMAAFPSAAAAFACAIAIQRQLEAYSNEHPDAPLRVRIGLNAGRASSFGAALIGAARICANARPGCVLLSESVHSLLSTSELTLERGKAWDI